MSDNQFTIRTVPAIELFDTAIEFLKRLTQKSNFFGNINYHFKFQLNMPFVELAVTLMAGDTGWLNHSELADFREFLEENPHLICRYFILNDNQDQNNFALSYADQDRGVGTLTINHYRNHVDGLQIYNSLKDSFVLVTTQQVFQDDMHKLMTYPTAVQENTRRELSEVLVKLNKSTAEQQEYFQKQMIDLRTKLIEEQTQQQHQQKREHDEKLKELELKKLAVEEREKQLDLHESRSKRRKHLEEIKNLLIEQSSVKLAKETNGLGQHVLGVAFGTVAGGMALCGFALFRISQSNVFHLHNALLFGSGFLLTASTMIYIMRWMNHKYTRHADTEFNNIQLHHDVLRASWLTEMIFESKESGDGVQIPDHLIHTFSQNLFEPRFSDGGHHPLDDIEKIARRFKRVKLEMGKSVIEVDKGSEEKAADKPAAKKEE